MTSKIAESMVQAEVILPAPYVVSPQELRKDNTRSIMEWIDTPLRTAIRNGEYTGDLTPQLTAALGSGEDIDLGVGVFRVEDSPVFTEQRQVLKGRDREKTIIKVDSEFNMAQKAVIHGVPFSEVYDLSVEFVQPPTATTKAELIQYPAAFYAAQRSQWRRIGWKSAWIGFDARGIDAINNTSGIIIDDVKDGSFEWSLRINDAFDFVSIDNWHSWEFGFTNTPLATIAYTDPGKFEIGHVETLDIKALRCWQKKIQLNNNSIFNTSIGILKLDGWSSRLEISSGYTQIGLLDIRCDNNTATSLIEQSNGILSVDNISIYSPNFRDTPLIAVSNGHLEMDQGFIAAEAQQRLGHTTGGTLEVGSVRCINGSNANRPTRPFWSQAGSGKLQVRDAEAPPKGSGIGSFVELASDAHHTIRADFQEWKLVSPVSYTNDYTGSINIGDDY